MFFPKGWRPNLSLPFTVFLSLSVSESWTLTHTHKPLPISVLSHSVPATPASLVFLQYTKHGPTSGPFHLLCCLECPLPISPQAWSFLLWVSAHVLPPLQAVIPSSTIPLYHGTLPIFLIIFLFFFCVCLFVCFQLLCQEPRHSVEPDDKSNSQHPGGAKNAC